MATSHAKDAKVSFIYMDIYIIINDQIKHKVTYYEPSCAGIKIVFSCTDSIVITEKQNLYRLDREAIVITEKQNLYR